MRRLWCGWVLLVAACAAERPHRYELSGHVTFKGQPVPVGTIVFVPDESKGNRGPGTSAGIADGRYRTPPGQGTIGGPHKVRLSGYDGWVRPIPGAPSGQMMPAGPPLFENVELEVEIPRADATLDFHLPRR